MTIVDDKTPVHYVLNRIYIFREGSEVTATALLKIVNAVGGEVCGDNPTAALTAAEKTALDAFITRELGVYETVTGLTEWTGG